MHSGPENSPSEVGFSKFHFHLRFTWHIVNTFSYFQTLDITKILLEQISPTDAGLDRVHPCICHIATKDSIPYYFLNGLVAGDG